MGSRRVIYTDIAPRPRLFFVRGKKNSRGQGRARVLTEGIFLPRTKKSLGLGAISVYIALLDPIYIINVPPFSISKEFTGKHFYNQYGALCKYET